MWYNYISILGGAKMKKIIMISMLLLLTFSCASLKYSCNSSSKNPKCNTKIDVSTPDINVNIK